MNNKNHFEEINDNALGEGVAGGRSCEGEHKAVPLYGIDRPIMPKYGVPENKDDKKDNNGQAQKLPDNTLGGVGGGIGAIEEKPVECFEKEGSDTECKGGKIPPMMLKYGVPPKKH